MQSLESTPQVDVRVSVESSKAGSSKKRWQLPSILFIIAGLAIASAGLVVYTLSDDPPKKPIEAKGSAWSYETVFPDWPKDRKPDFVIVITGQTYGYLQKCGCSDPQKGGLERRFNFIDGFKAHGIEVIPLDIGDVSPHLTGDYPIQHAQALLKYKTAMMAMKAMGYRAVAVGKEEFSLGLLDALSEYSLQPGNATPKVLGANLANKAQAFPSAVPGEAMVHDFEMIPTKSRLNVGVVGIVGDPVINEAKKLDGTLAFAKNSGEVVAETLKAMMKQPTKPNLAVLLYNGPIELAQKAAAAFPQFRIVACLNAEAEPPNQAQMVGNTMIVRVGHKGQNVGVVGVFRDNKGGFDLKYQRVAMTPEFETPEGKEAQNLALQELERYSQSVKAREFLTKQKKAPHPLQFINPKATFVGSNACMICHNDHGDSWQVYAGSKHAQAYAALDKIAKRPSLRNFDPECIRCHTVGYDHNSGFISTQKTPQLMNVGCESCHGPGSEHVANPLNKKFSLELSPWKKDPTDHLPALAKFKQWNDEKDEAKKQKIFNQAENQMILRVHDQCQKCHNLENDPHFKFEAFWPKVAHSKKPNAVGPKKEDGPKLTPPGGPELQLPKN